MANLNALYYPYASIDAAALKEAALYFNQVVIVDPEAIDGRLALAAPSAVSRSPEELDEVYQLANAGVCKATAPEDIRKQWDGILRENVLADLQDPRYVRLCAKAPWQQWTLSANKVASGLFEHLHDLANGVPEALPTGVRDWVSHHFDLAGSDIRIDDEGRLYMGVPFILGESIMINLAICACATLNVSPFTDDRWHNRFLNLKYRRLQEDPDPDVRDLLNVGVETQDIVTTALAQEVIRRLLPSVGDLPAEKVLEMRRKYAAQLEDFRTELALLSKRIVESPWSADFKAELRRAVDLEIAPRVRELRWELQAEVDGFRLRSLSGEPPRNAVEIVTTVLQGVPITGLILAAGRAVLNVARSWLRHRAEVRGLQRNGLTYMLTLRRELARSRK